jgi:hypothetical protein
MHCLLPQRITPARLIWLAALATPAAFAATPDIDSQHIWSLSATGHGAGQQQRWLVIHDVADTPSTGVYHIEVLGKAGSLPPWQVTHLATHMAVTREALLRSVGKPLKRGAVYPETFDNALAQWLASGNAGEVCTTLVTKCLAK